MTGAVEHLQGELTRLGLPSAKTVAAHSQNSRDPDLEVDLSLHCAMRVELSAETMTRELLDSTMCILTQVPPGY